MAAMQQVLSQEQVAQINTRASKVALTPLIMGAVILMTLVASGRLGLSGGQTNISNKRTSHTEPTWSPDGSRIAFTNARKRGQIYVMKADGSRQKKLSRDSNLSYKQPAWSPDGARIAFTGSTEQSYFHGWAYGADSGNIFVADADGSNRSQLTSGSSDYGPSWSPDGTKIAFSRVQLIDGVPSRNIYVMDADGSNVTQIMGKEE